MAALLEARRQSFNSLWPKQFHEIGPAGARKNPPRPRHAAPPVRILEPDAARADCTHRSCSLRTAGSAWARPRLPTLQCSGAVVSPLRITEPTTRAPCCARGSCSSAPWSERGLAGPNRHPIKVRPCFPTSVPALGWSSWPWSRASRDT